MARDEGAGAQYLQDEGRSCGVNEKGALQRGAREE